MVEIVVVIRCLFRLVIPVISVKASSLVWSDMVVVPCHMLVRLVAMDVVMMVMVDMSSAPVSVSNSILVGPTMIFPPIVNGIEKALLV